MPRKIDYSFWLEPPDPGTDEEYGEEEESDIPAVVRELDDRFPEVLQKWPDIWIRRSKFPSGLPRVEILLRISNREDSAQALEAVFGIAKDLGGWEIHSEHTSWTIGEDRQELLDGMEQEIENQALWRMQRWIEIAFVPLVIVFCSLSLGALAGLVSGWLFLAFFLALIVLGVFVKRRMPSPRAGRP